MLELSSFWSSGQRNCALLISLKLMQLSRMASMRESVSAVVFSSPATCLIDVAGMLFRVFDRRPILRVCGLYGCEKPCLPACGGNVLFRGKLSSRSYVTLNAE